VALLTSKTPAAERRRLLARLARGEVDVLVGTHALLLDDVRFSSLGVVVIDEQHRFGVDQRAALREKGSAEPEGGRDPDLLVMTATPIPRTAAMTVYGDLDYSVLDELPPGRTPVETRWVRDEAGEATVWATVRAELIAGRQAYVVCPLVRESASDDEGAGEGLEYALDDDEHPDGQLFAPPEPGRAPPRAAIEEHARLVAGELAGFRVGLLHGQLSGREKDKQMAAFRDGLVQVLVATTVIEVGVDVPNATVMVIEDADRFGIAQLHQLRGRVGRGAAKSWCYLLSEAATPDGEERLAAMERTNDGFALAEVDLDLRGEGTILGTRQKGVNDLKLASLRRHRKYVTLARQVAFDIVGPDPALAGHPALARELRALVDDDDGEYLFKS
jgi:ATP-dependent DNA helicase RecG